MQMDVRVNDVPLPGVLVDIQDIAVEVEWKSLLNEFYRGEDKTRIMCWLVSRRINVHRRRIYTINMLQLS